LRRSTLNSERATDDRRLTTEIGNENPSARPPSNSNDPNTDYEDEDEFEDDSWERSRQAGGNMI